MIGDSDFSIPSFMPTKIISRRQPKEVCVGMTGIRFRIEPRDLPAAKAARRLGLTEAEFDGLKDRLFARGFPRPDQDTGNYDLKAVENWMDHRSGLTNATFARDASSVLPERLEMLRGEGKAR